MTLLLHLLIITSQIVNTEARPLKKPSHEVRLPVEVKIGNHATIFLREASLGEVFLVPNLCYFPTNYDLPTNNILPCPVSILLLGPHMIYEYLDV